MPDGSDIDALKAALAAAEAEVIDARAKATEAEARAANALRAGAGSTNRTGSAVPVPPDLRPIPSGHESLADRHLHFAWRPANEG